MTWSTDDITTLRAMVLAGEDEDATARVLRKKRAEVRDMVTLLGLTFSPLAKLEWCDKCCSPRHALDPVTGWCEACTIQARNEYQRMLDDQEEERLRKEAEKATNQIKKARERTREEFDANPRKGTRDEDDRLFEQWLAGLSE